jgi:RNA polymerase sigma-70 factor (ECF subfamily)
MVPSTMRRPTRLEFAQAPVQSEILAASPDERFDVVSAGVVEHLSSMRGYARSLARNPERADDLVHDAILRALSAAQQFTPGTNFGAWIFTIIRNLFYNEGRKAWSQNLPLDALGPNEPASSAGQEDCLTFCDFRRAFWQLAPEYREVLILVCVNGMKYEDVAALCKYPVGTVKSRVSRGRHELKALLSGNELALSRADVTPAAGGDLVAMIVAPPDTTAGIRAGAIVAASIK